MDDHQPCYATVSDPPADVAEREQRAWLARHRRGDTTAFADLVRAYQQPIYSFLTRCGVDPASRDDLFQDIFLKLHTSAARYRADQPLRPWLFTIAANTIRNHFRARQGRPLTLAGPLDAEQTADAGPGLERQVESQQTLAWLEQALGALPLLQRQVILLNTVHGMTLSDIALALDIPLNSVKTYLRRARLQLIAARARRDAAEDDGHAL